MGVVVSAADRTGVRSILRHVGASSSFVACVSQSDRAAGMTDDGIKRNPLGARYEGRIPGRETQLTRTLMRAKCSGMSGM